MATYAGPVAPNESASIFRSTGNDALARQAGPDASRAPAQKQNGGWYGGVQYWAPGQGPAASNNVVPSGPSASDFDTAFAPQFQALDNLQHGLETDQTNQLATAQGKHDNQAGVLGGQVAGLQTNLAKNKTDWNNTKQGAYADALQAYNAKQQQRQAMYGGQSSAGDATNDILTQQMLRTQGDLSGQDASAQLTFQGQDQDIQNWAADQHAKLDNWLLDAQQSIKSVFQQGINQINADRGQTESAKSQAKLGLLQQLFTHQQQIQDYDNQLRMQVELAGKNLPQNSMDTTVFQNQVANYQQGAQASANGFNQYTANPTSTAASNNALNISMVPGTKKIQDIPGLTFSQ